MTRARPGRATRRVLLLLVLLALPVTAGCLSLLSRTYIPRREIRKPEHGVAIDRHAAMTTRDGVELVSRVYSPRGPERSPTLLMRVPLAATWMNTRKADAIGRFFASRGYTVVFQGTRGRFHSEGAYYPFRPQRRDGIDTLRWLESRPWYDGRIGMWGGSSFGYTQWVLADQEDPGPRALAIQISSSSLHDMFYRGGAFSLESALLWAIRAHREDAFWVLPELLERAVGGLPLLEADSRYVADIAWFNDWASHVGRDRYWLEIDGRDRPERLKAPVLLLAGWFDPFLPGQLDDFRRIRRGAAPAASSATRLIIGPWAHAREVALPDGFEPRRYSKHALGSAVEWFDRHLRGEPTEPETAPVRIFVMGENTWRDEQEWPLARTRYVPWYLHSGGSAGTALEDGRLETEPPASDQPADTYVFDPLDPVPSAGGALLGPRAGVARQNAVESRPDVLVYTSAALEEDLEVTGPVELILHVSTSAPATDFTGKLVDVHPDGTAWNVSDGILRRSYPERGEGGGPEVTEIAIELWPTSIVFREGHRIRLEVSSSNFPRYDRNPNTGGFVPSEIETVPATQGVHHGPSTPSRLVLPVIPG